MYSELEMITVKKHYSENKYHSIKENITVNKKQMS